MLSENIRYTPSTRHSTRLLLILLAFLVLGLGACDTPAGTDNDGPAGPADPVEPFSHTEVPGTSNADFLTDEEFNTLIIEIDYMPDMKPTPEALQSLQEFLEKWLKKTEIIIQEPGQIPPGNQDSYNADQIRILEEEHRDTFSDRENRVLAAYNIIVDGEYENENVLGIAYYNTSNAFFGETIRQVSGSPPLYPTLEKIESTVFRHEFGHLLGLVNNGTEAQNEGHHDSENDAHCTNDECLMYWAVETRDFFANTLEGDKIPDLDSYCEEDIQAVQNQ